MTALAQPQIGPHTLAEWHRADQPVDGSRLELLAGSWSVSPAPGFRHQRLADRLCRLLDDQIPGCAVSAVAVDLSTTTRTGLIPDVVALRKEPDSDGAVAVNLVELVVEVWSPGNSDRERVDKRAAYAAAGVPYFWELTQDTGRFVLTAERLVSGQYRADVRLSAGSGPTTVSTAPVPVEVDTAALVL